MPPKVSEKKDKAKETKFYGLHACLSLVELRPEDTIRAYVVKEQMGRFSAYLKWCAKTQRAYHIVTAEKMESIASSTHHEGICILAYERKILDEKGFFISLKRGEIDENIPLVYLDGTKNPHNVGAILRTLAHYGIEHVIGQVNDFPRVGGSLARISKGGSEQVQVIKVESPLAFCTKMAQLGYKIVRLSNKVQDSIYDFSWPKKTILIFGNETSGISKALAEMKALEFKIPGTSRVESLNVSVACGIVINEWSRKMGAH